MDRRHFSLTAGAALLGLATTGCAQKMWAKEATRPDTPDPRAADAARRFAAIEQTTGCRLGVGVIDTHTGTRYGYREHERFPMCSTFKTLASGFVLHRVDQGQERLDRRVRFSKADLVDYSPGTEKHAGGDGMTVVDICSVMTTLSDNTAANLMLASFGGPDGLTAWLRSIGDATTRLDRNEPTLNSAIPGDPRDTTTPAAMASTLRALALGSVLSPASREQFVAWLVANRTGDTRLRAGVPAGWTVGDKTGTGTNGTHNDIAVMWPAGRGMSAGQANGSKTRGPVIVTTYLTEAAATAPARRDAAIVEVAQWVAAAVG
ncbi:class A beta-lactamase [Pigmentiphaga litoralis]|uniref:class A beta-lactamase n=1 Tax=Pigmentiphaga litoralis TaxID=516702 RepID=UPI00167AA6FC|nr:class A beta-lactamase [Pigmentiphaga litoralis]